MPDSVVPAATTQEKSGTSVIEAALESFGERPRVCAGEERHEEEVRGRVWREEKSRRAAAASLGGKRRAGRGASQAGVQQISKKAQNSCVRGTTPRGLAVPNRCECAPLPPTNQLLQVFLIPPALCSVFPEPRPPSCRQRRVSLPGEPSPPPPPPNRLRAPRLPPPRHLQRPPS